MRGVELAWRDGVGVLAYGVVDGFGVRDEVV